MSTQRKGSKRGTGWKPPRDRREIVVAILASLAVIVVTASLLWLLRPNRDSGSSDTSVTTPSTVPVDATTTTAVPTTSVPADGTVAPTTAPAATSTP